MNRRLKFGKDFLNKKAPAFLLGQAVVPAF